MSSSVKSAVFWVLAILVVFLLWAVVTQKRTDREDELDLTRFMVAVKENRVKEITIDGTEGKGKYNDNRPFRVMLPTFYPDLPTKLVDAGVKATYKTTGSGGPWIALLINSLPVLALLGVVILAILVRSTMKQRK
uniref:Peptidase M41 FtsH extracellular domain-containing protein n=1 Tax=Tolypothrix bouteillei VB521301 TaxID=1479485 RepID=A0A0C1R8R4_9CYAN